MAAKVFEIEVYPSFEGFPDEGIKFLQSLKRNNKREWFEAHKGEYEAFVRLPMFSLITSLQPYFTRFAPEFDLNPKRSIFRIYRDIRFSKDKTPYKTHVAAHFVLRGAPKGLEGLGYYLHIEPGEVFLGAGIYIPNSQQLRKIRRAIATRSDGFLDIVESKAFKRRFTGIDGQRLTRVPQGFDADDPMAEWLKLKQFFIGVTLDDRRCRSKSFVAEAAKVYEEGTPLVKFLLKSMA